MFEFPWFFWMMVFFIFFGCGRMCGWGARRYMDHRHYRDRHEDKEEEYDLVGSRKRATRLSDEGARPDRFIRAGSAFGRGEEREREPVRMKARGTPLQRLQKRFVDGQISLDEYERQLDHLERLD